MPVSYAIDRGLGIVRITCSGVLTMDEMVGYFATLARDPARVGTFHTLVDLRAVTAMLETGQLRHMTDQLATLPSTIGFGACAIVANDPLSEGGGKLFSVFARERYRAITVVPTIEDAEAWLRLQPLH
jgi:hypothetical protein